MELKSADSEALSMVKEALQYFRSMLANDIPVQQVIILLTVAEKPGITQTDLAGQVGMSASSISRSLRMLGRYVERNSSTEKGHGVIETRPDLRERNRQACFLTKRGEDIIKGLDSIITDGKKGAEISSS